MTLRCSLALALAWGISGTALTLGVGSSAHWVPLDLPALNSFVRLVNETVAFVNERVPGEPVPPLAGLRHGVGLRIGQDLGELFRVGMSMAVAGGGTAVRGAWSHGGSSHPVEVALDVGFVSLGLELGVTLADVLTVTLAAGWGQVRVSHRCAFPRTLPTDWTLPFLPKNEDRTYTAGGFVGAVAAGLSLPVGGGARVGVEVGFRLAPLGVPRAGETVLDLNADGLGDPVVFTGIWLGVALRVELGL
ncbi:MAG: hypothetical protein N2320_03085 [Candidatus Bipolaricaulota bacterium]|nr:hypothetical protein [Candidatus Bipolaricaulota bacterium]